MFTIVLVTIVSGLIGGLLLNIFYAAVKHAWPDNYFGISGTVDPVVSRNLGRYAIFRFGPPLLVMSAVAVTADRAGGAPLLAILIGLTVHSLGLVYVIWRSARRRRYTAAGGHLLVLVALVSIGLFANAFRGYFRPLVPDPSAVVESLWIGVLAAVGAVYVQRIALVKRSPLLVVRNAAKAIPRSLLRYARDSSRAAGVDPKITLSLMIAEDLQRPKWFRAFEKWFPGPRAERTTGIMQQRGARTDIESIDLAMTKFIVPASNKIASRPDVEPDVRDQVIMSECAGNYNRDADFADLTMSIYGALDEDPRWFKALTA